MKRLTRLCKDTDNGKYIPYTVGSYTGILPDCTLGEVVERLAKYEDLMEEWNEGIWDAIYELSDIRAGYSVFDKEERKKYHACSLAIKALRELIGE